ncbi:RNA-directed DNA polymerase from mobile element jockey-like [Brachionus plicatilis]|uniref:RNA-directed DNA polymerase from mobile element jockey-like n=1 Tax=Brachionus plicatilis TaxID=10195 RepID=A0A3M7SIY9_BRAPC|nr:RNA-directed DNA polymerase from mobile element jockey-like [Brachionus plicatilis]
MVLGLLFYSKPNDTSILNRNFFSPPFNFDLAGFTCNGTKKENLKSKLQACASKHRETARVNHMSKMTNLTDAMTRQVDARIIEAFKTFLTNELVAALGRIKSLEETVARLELTITEQSEEIASQQKVTKELKTNGAVLEPSNVWKALESNPAVKSSFLGMVSVERNSAQQKEKNLVIFGVKEISEPNGVKEEVLSILDEIGMKRHGSNAKSFRFKGIGAILQNLHRFCRLPQKVKKQLFHFVSFTEQFCMKFHNARFKPDGPITVSFESTEVKMKVLKEARNLRSSVNYKKVYIYMDLTKSEMERNKELRKQQLELNMALELGSGYLKYGMHKFSDGEDDVAFYWGIRHSYSSTLWLDVSNGLGTDNKGEDSVMGLDLEEDNVIRSASGSSDRELTWNESLKPDILTETEASDCFLDCLTECFLVQNVFFKTFQHDETRLTNLLDLVITESKERIYELKPGPILGGQDHGHLVNPNHKPKLPWLTKEIREMMRRKSDMWHRFVSGGRRNEELHEEYKVQCKLVKSSISSNISSFELELAKNSVKNPKGLFTYINKKQKMTESIRSLNDCSGTSTTDKSEMAEILSCQFESIFSFDDGSEPIFENRTKHLCSEEVMGNVPMRNYSLPNRNATTWNLLPSDIVEADNVSVFKSRIDRHIRLESLRRSVYRV